MSKALFDTLVPVTMLPKGTISKVIDYFTQTPNFVPAFSEALCMFFEVDHVSELERTPLSTLARDFFNEWLVFDMELDTRRTLLQEYLYLRQDELSREEKRIYTDLVLTQHYSLFRCDAIVPGKSMTMYDLLTGGPYPVSEYMATFEAQTGSYSFMRVAMVGESWNIVSADSFQIPPEAIPNHVLADWRKRNMQFNPLNVYQQMFKPLEKFWTEQKH